MDIWDGTAEDLDKIINPHKPDISPEDRLIDELLDSDISDEDDIAEEIREFDEEVMWGETG